MEIPKESSWEKKINMSFNFIIAIYTIIVSPIFTEDLSIQYLKGNALQFLENSLVSAYKNNFR